MLFSTAVKNDIKGANSMFKKIVLFSATAACFTSAAQANLLLKVNRISDQTAIVTGTGTLDTSAPQGDAFILFLDNIFSNPLSGYQNDGAFLSSTLTVGSAPIDFANTAGSRFNFGGTGNPALYFGSSTQSFSTSNAINGGALNLSLPTGYSFANIESTGTVYWGVYSVNGAYVVGSYEIVAVSAVPEPTTVALLGLGLLGFAASRRKSVK